MTQSPTKRQRNNKNSSEETLEVVCRIKEYQGENPCVLAQDENYVRVISPNLSNRHGEVMQEKVYRFGYVFDGCDSQRTVFDRCCMDLLNDLVKGRNGLLFAYGVTGGGKTYTMTGNKGKCGILPRAADVLFNSIQDLTNRCVFYSNGRNGFSIRSEIEAFKEQRKLPLIDEKIIERANETKRVNFPRGMAATVFVSYIEIYNDQCYDLLDDTLTSDIRTNMSKNVRIDTNGQVYVDRLTEFEVQSSDEILLQYLKAQERRKMAKTLLNANSSRSHSIFNIRLVMAEASPTTDIFNKVMPIEDDSKVIVSQLSIVDLAGSERAKRTQNHGDRLAEASKINQSLLSLRKCFDQLRENQRRGTNAVNVSYRDHKLTLILKNFFEGHGRMRMIVCVNPQPQDYEENILVMSFAETAQTLELPKFERPSLPFTNLANLPYSRRDMEIWYQEVSPIVNFESRLKINLFAPPPKFELFGPDDNDSIRSLREYYEERRTKYVSLLNTTNSNADLFSQKMSERLCVADLDRRRINELENELDELNSYNATINSKKNQIERQLNAMKQRLFRYENNADNNRKREEEARAREQENIAAIQQQRKTLLKVSEMLETPVPTTSNVAALRRNFLGDTPHEQNRKPKAHIPSKYRARKSPYPIDSATPTVVGAYGINRNTPLQPSTITSNIGYMNPRFHRRSRSAGARVLNHQPLNKIQTGTIFQPKYPKKTKHTVQLDSSDLEKCDEYITTNQIVDSDGNLTTDLVKGTIIPTAGGGSAVMFCDVETLQQQDSPTKRRVRIESQ